MIEGTNPATSHGREEMTENTINKFRYLITGALVAQQYNTQFTIQRLVVRILPLAPGEAIWQKYYQ
jgi:hypothetical protein